MKTYILFFDLDYYPNEHWVRVVSAWDLDAALHLVHEAKDNTLPDGDHNISLDIIKESLSEWIELPIALSKGGTYFPKTVTHAIAGGEHTNLKSIEILKPKQS